MMPAKVNYDYRLTINSLGDVFEFFQEVALVGSENVHYTSNGTAPTIEACYDAAQDYLSEVLQAAADERSE